MSGSLLFETLSAARDLGRLHEIASVLVRHGMGDVLRRMGVAPALERAGRILHLHAAEGLADHKPEQRVREALEELGPTFVKVGQILAGRTDLLGPDWTRELAKLQEHAEEVPIADIRAQLLEDLGAPPEEVFRDFDPVPLAAASIAQVHRASLEDGTPVVLKVRRPGIDEVADADLRLLSRLAELAEQEITELRRFRPTSLVRQLTRSLRAELDMRVEARNAIRLRELLSDDAKVVLPRIHERWTHERLCVMDFLDGPSLGHCLETGDLRGVDPREAAQTGANAVLEMIFVHGFFHADPHPGNVLVLEGGRLGLVDFGMMGSLSDVRRIEFLELLAAVSGSDEPATTELLLDWSRDGDVDHEHLRDDCRAFLDRYHGMSLQRIDTSQLLGEITSITRDNELFLPDEVALLIKVFVTLESLGRRLDPEFTVSRHVAPFAKKALAEHYSARAWVGRATREATHLLARLPRHMRRLGEGMRQGKVKITMDVAQLDRFGQQLVKSANRVTIGLVTSALIVGTSISLTVSHGPTTLGMPLFALLGFGTSSLGGFWLLWLILRSRR